MIVVTHTNGEIAFCQMSDLEQYKFLISDSDFKEALLDGKDCKYFVGFLASKTSTLVMLGFTDHEPTDNKTKAYWRNRAKVIAKKGGQQ